MSRATSIAGVRPLGWLARLRAHSAAAWRGRAQRSSSCLADGAGAAGLGPFTALGNGARDELGGQAKMQTDTLHAPGASEGRSGGFCVAWYKKITVGFTKKHFASFLPFLPFGSPKWEKRSEVFLGETN